MLGFYKRKLGLLAFAFLFSLVFALGCAVAIPPINDDSLLASDVLNSENGEFNGLSVHFLDVGQGDSILICFPDKTNMLIDCASSAPFAVNNVKTALEIKGITALDTLVLTHPDVDHIGGVKSALKDIKIKKVYHPDIDQDRTGFEEYFSVIEFLDNKGSEKRISLRGECFGEDYKMVFLSPLPKRADGSTYRDLHFATQPTDKQINDVSPFIYLEYKGVRFLFTGDNSSAQETNLLTDYNSGILVQTFSNKGLNLKLEDIDFLKIAHHGSSDSTSSKFLSVVKPKNAIISVGGSNAYGHPASSTLERLQKANPSFKLWRTDENGAISVFVTDKGQIEIKTAEKD